MCVCVCVCVHVCVPVHGGLEVTRSNRDRAVNSSGPNPGYPGPGGRKCSFRHLRLLLSPTPSELQVRTPLPSGVPASWFEAGPVWRGLCSQPTAAALQALLQG